MPPGSRPSSRRGGSVSETGAPARGRAGHASGQPAAMGYNLGVMDEALNETRPLEEGRELEPVTAEPSLSAGELAEREILPAAPKTTTPARKLKIIRTGSLAQAIDEIVPQALRQNRVHATPAQERGIRESIRKRLLKTLEQKGKKVRGLTKSGFLLELDRSRNQILLERDAAREELGAVMDKLSFYRGFQEEDESALIEETVLPPAHQMELHERVLETFRNYAEGRLTQEDLQREVLEIATNLAEDERRRTIEERVRDHRNQVELFERRISKLNVSLEETESALAHLEKSKDADHGVASVYRTVQGLSHNEAHKRLKNALLRKVFEANVALQAK